MYASKRSKQGCLLDMPYANICSIPRSILLEIGIFASHFVWLYRTRRIRKEARFVGMSYDEYIGYGKAKVLIMGEKNSLSRWGRLHGTRPPLRRNWTDVLRRVVLPQAAAEDTPPGLPCTTEREGRRESEKPRTRCEDCNWAVEQDIDRKVIAEASYV